MRYSPERRRYERQRRSEYVASERIRAPHERRARDPRAGVHRVGPEPRRGRVLDPGDWSTTSFNSKPSSPAPMCRNPQTAPSAEPAPPALFSNAVPSTTESRFP